LMCCVVRWTV